MFIKDLYSTSNILLVSIRFYRKSRIYGLFIQPVENYWGLLEELLFSDLEVGQSYKEGSLRLGYLGRIWIGYLAQCHSLLLKIVVLFIIYL